MFEEISEYILLSKEKRTTHLDLEDKCVEIGGNSREYRGVLAWFLHTTIPTGMKIHLCHACNNSKCSNPKHLYWGTPLENYYDAINSGKVQTIHEKLIAKYTPNQIAQIRINAASKGGKAKAKKRNPPSIGFLS